MDLGARLEKLGARVSVTNAAHAFGRSLRGPVSEAERVLAEEFKALIEAMVLMAAVDGFVTDDELKELRSSVTKMVPPEAAIEGGLDELTAACLEKLTSDGWQSRITDVAQRLGSAESRSLAFRLAAGIAFVDDDVARAEAEVIDALAESFGLSPDDSQAILREVVEDLYGAQ